MTEIAPEEKAARAAEALAAEGVAVTARAVRERAGVRTVVASSAAKQWNDQEAERLQAPPMPAAVRSRLDALWREAYIVARADFDDERAGLNAKIRHATEEIAELTRLIETAEEDSARAATEAAAAQALLTEELAAARAKAAEDATQHADLLSSERSRGDRAEGALEAVTVERDRLLAEIRELRSGID